MSRLPLVLPLIFGSGACALAYQVAWLRQFRLLFGASTAASAAVLAIFIGGLGIGSWILGPRADKERSPLAFYAKLEVGIAIAAALSPLLLWVAQAIYLGLGGSTSLGMFGASVVRLILAAVVLLPPTFLMGGTLPAAARFLETNANVSRQNTALLYGTNTLGAVTGAFIANFILVEELGNRGALFLAALFNLTIAGLAFLVSRLLVEQVKRKKIRTKKTAAAAVKAPSEAPRKPLKKTRSLASERNMQAPERAILVAAGVVGFAFFLMEMVWYRVLSPLIGGTVFSMGLILSVALLGVGIGGIAYAFRPSGRRPTLHSLSVSCGLEAILLVGPFAFGDDIALWTGLLQNFSNIGFWGQVFGWTAISAIVILPGAIVSGYQFPLLIALLGQGREGIGRDAGRAYALNTVGAVTGSLAGGFGLMPLVGARGCWTTVALSLVGLAIYAAWLHQRALDKPVALAWPLALGTIALGLTFAQGPSTFWRHSGIGIGRFHAKNLASPNDIQEFKNWHRRALLWEKDGVESGIALLQHQGMAFVVNGKIDGHATLDAPTQIMSGLIGSLLHPNPRRALVIGLGTGSTAGWLAQVDTMERVDVSELEPAILQVARDCHHVNHDVLDNPKVNMIIGDGRELLLTTQEKYDVIFSEPSNPYRAGIASFFTHEFYEATQERLAEDGILVQWIQSYEINPGAIELVYATVGKTFPYVETWRTHRDLLLLASKTPPRRTMSMLRERIVQEPYRSGLREAWTVSDIEGLFSYYVADTDFAKDLNASFEGPINSDDRNLLEFDFARSVGKSNLFSVDDALSLAQARHQDRPSDLVTELNWGAVNAQRAKLYSQARQGAAKIPTDPSTYMSLSDLIARAGNVGTRDAALSEQLAARLDPSSKEEAQIVRAAQALSDNQPEVALQLLTEVFTVHRSDPWIVPQVARRGLRTLVSLAKAHPEKKAQIVALISEPFAAHAVSDAREQALIDITTEGNSFEGCVEAFAPFEDHPDFRLDFLRTRIACYKAQGHPLLNRAQEDLEVFESGRAVPFGKKLNESGKPTKS